MNIKRTFKSGGGTSFHGVVVYCKYDQLVQIFGEPKNNTCEDKVNYEWIIEVDDNVCTIYDWKEYREIPHDEYIKWNIGGNNKTIEEKLKEYIENKLSLTSES